MPHYGPLISIIVGGLVLAFTFGAIAHRLKASPLVGYLLAGVVVGPFTPGFVADQDLANELSEIGVILLMFGVGLHFSMKDLMSVRAIALPGAIVQIAVATVLGMGLAWALGWNIGAGIVFGLALSVASTVVLLRALQERRMVETERGRIAVGWLIVEDLVMVLVLVLMPALAGIMTGDASKPAHATLGSHLVAPYGIAGLIGLTIGKVIAFVALMLLIGRRLIPILLHYVAHTGSRELFRLAVLAVALGVAYGAATLFDVSFALGAFFAGMVLSESPLSHRAAEETLPLRDAFAVLFFVSVGMLFDPSIVLRDPWPLLGTLLIILVGKSVAALVIVRAFGHSLATAITIAASLAQIGEFSFILASLGGALGLLPAAGRDLILAGAILSILVNPFMFMLGDRLRFRAEKQREAAAPATSDAAEAAPPPEPAVDLPMTTLSNHAVVIGYGRVGALVGTGLRQAALPFLVIEDRDGPAERAMADGAEVVRGNAADPRVLAAANLSTARRLFVAIPEAFEAGQVVQQARTANPDLEIIARAHSDAEVDYLTTHGASFTVMGEREIARGMLEHALNGKGPASGSEPPEPTPPGAPVPVPA